MTQQNNDPRRDDLDTLGENKQQNTGDASAGSQAATTGYGTGQTEGQGTAASQQGQDSPSNSGNAGLQGSEGGQVSEERTDQMSHADGSSEADDPDV